MMFISSLGLGNSKLPGKAKLFAFMFSAPLACFLKFFWIIFVDTSASITLQWKGSDPYASTTTGITFVLYPAVLDLLSQVLDIFQLAQLPFFLTRPSLTSFVIGKSINWLHLGLLITKSGLLAAIHDLFEHWIPSKTWSFLFSFRWDVRIPARTQWITPSILSFLLFDYCASFGHELRIWSTVSASALRLVNLCFNVIST